MERIPMADLEAETSEDPEYARALEGYDVVDVDAHYMESIDAVTTYMDEPWRSRLAGSGFNDAGQKQNMVTLFSSSQGDRQQWGKIEREHSSYPTGSATREEVLDAMEFLGLDVQVQISHVLLAMHSVTADDRRLEQFIDGWVDYQRNEVVDPDDGIYSLTPIDPQNVDHALELVDVAADEDGFVGACLVTGGASPMLGNRKWDPIYERCEKRDVPLVLHTGGAGLDSPQFAGARSFLETHTLGFLQSNQDQLTSIVFQGVLERFPDLELVVMESGVTYLPALGARMDEEYLKRAEEAPLLEKLPSEYLRDITYGTQPLETETDPAFLEHCVEMIGVENLVYASDYPHWDFDRPTTITDLPFLDEDEKQRILADNAKEVFDL